MKRLQDRDDRRDGNEWKKGKVDARGPDRKGAGAAKGPTRGKPANRGGKK